MKLDEYTPPPHNVVKTQMISTKLKHWANETEENSTNKEIISSNS